MCSVPAANGGGIDVDTCLLNERYIPERKLEIVQLEPTVRPVNGLYVSTWLERPLFPIVRVCGTPAWT